MYRCTHCNKTFSDKNDRGILIFRGEMYCKECEEPVVEIPDMLHDPDAILGAQATLISNSDNRITTNNYFGGGIPEEQIDTPYGLCFRSEPRFCKKCRKLIPLMFFNSERGLCDDCMINEGIKAYDEGKTFYKIGLYKDALDSFQKYEHVCKDLEELVNLQVLIGQCYFEQKQWKEAFRYFVKTRDKNADSLFYIGLFFYFGYGDVSKNEGKAKEHFQKAIQKGCQKAIDFIADEKRRIQEEQEKERHKREMEVKRKIKEEEDRKKAEAWNRKMAEINRKKKEEEEKLRKEKEIKEAIKALLDKADRAFENKEYLQVVESFKDAEKMGHKLSTREYNVIGYCYFQVKRYNDAIQYFTFAMKTLRDDAHSVSAMFNIGNCYEYGLGVSESLEWALKFYTDAAKKGNRESQYRLGLLYAHSDKIGHIKNRYPQKYLTATDYYNKEREFPCPQNNEEAKKWFRMAADKGHEEAKRELLLLK